MPSGEALDLEIRQREWLDLQRQLDAAADLLEAQGVQTDREPWCWNDSPHAARLTEIEQMLET